MKYKKLSNKEKMLDSFFYLLLIICYLLPKQKLHILLEHRLVKFSYQLRLYAAR